MAFQQERTFVRMAVPAHDEVHAVGLQDGQHIFPHFSKAGFGIGIVGTFGIGRMVPVDNGPILGICLKVVFQPNQHGRAGIPARPVFGIQYDEMNVGEVERIISFGSGSQPAGFAVFGKVKNIEVGVELVDGIADVNIVVADRRPKHGLNELFFVHVLKQSRLVLLVRTGIIGIVSQQKDEVSMSIADVVVIAIAHRAGVAVAGAAIAQHPCPDRLRGAGIRRGLEEMVGVPSGKNAGVVAHGVIITGVGRQAG